MPKKISPESSLAVQDEPASEQKKHKKHSKRDSGGSSPSMPNKVASETSLATQDEAASEPKKPKNQGNEIDEIFSNKKRKKPKQEQDNKPIEDVNPKLKKSKKEKKSKVARTAGFVDPPVKSRKKTEDGLTVYAEEELGIGRADAGGEISLHASLSTTQRKINSRNNTTSTTTGRKMSLLHHVEWAPSLLGCLLTKCTRQRSMNVGRSLHAYLVKRRGWLSSDYLYLHNQLLNLYVKLHKLEWAHHLFDIMPNRNTVSWTVLISGYDQNKRPHTALHIFSLMLSQDPASPPNHFTFASALSACSKQENLSLGMQLHSHVFRRGFIAYVMVSNVLISLYMACRQVTKGELVFQEIIEPDQVSWNSLVSGLSQNCLSHATLDKFLMMRESGVGVTCFALSAAIAACLDNEADLKRLHGLAVKIDLNLDSYVGCAMIRGYSKFKKMEDAMEVFAGLRLKDIASWNSLFEGYAECDQGEKGLQVFATFLESGLEPDDITITSILGICTDLVMLDYGRQVHSFSVKTGLQGKIRVDNSIIHMYSKCGSIEDGIKFFNLMKQRSLVSWTTMMGGLAEHGRAEEVIQLFQEMNREGLKPNKVTYNCVLSACSHAGLVDLGRSLFESMEIEPDIDHFTCIVHMLAGRGRFKEAEEFIQGSKEEYRRSLWLAFLVACNNLGEWVQGANVAAKMMTICLPSEPHVLVLFSNIFAAAGRWEEASNLREEMRSRGLKKEPGCSWLEKG